MSAEIESSVSPPALNLEKCSVVLLDVAGTTTSINFVKETLFPYATSKAEEYLKSHWDNDGVKESVKLLKDSELTLEDAVTAFKELTEQNSENKGLKTIQGLIYKTGYENGDLKAHVFSDVPSSLEAWTKSKKIAIYSTGSVESQKLLFSHTTEGDVSMHITKYFDQGVGSKTESQSYENIAKELETEKTEIVFITDNVEEAKAAKTCGLVTVLVKREGNEPLSEEASKEYSVVSSFKEIVFENPAKRKNEDEVAPTEEQPPSKLAKKEVTEENPVVADTPVADTPVANPSEKAEKKEADVESMDVDGAVEKTEVTVGESAVKPTEAPIENEKTESIEKKTDDISQPVDKDEPKETAVTAEIPMETSDAIDESKDSAAKTEETAAKDSKVEIEPETTKKIDESANKDSKNEPTEKMDASDINDKVENGTCDTTEAEVVDTSDKKEVVTDSVDEKLACDVDQNIVETAKDKKETENDKTNDQVSEENKKTVSSESKVDEKVESVCKEKVLGDVKEKKMVEDKLEPSVKSAETSDKNNTEEKRDEKKESEEKPVEAGSVVEEKPKGVGECKSDKKTAKDEDTVSTEKVDDKEKSPKEGEEPENKDEKDVEKESKEEKAVEEKENKSELANGVENGKAETETAVNGDTEEKSSDEKKVDEADKVEEIKVKKVEDASDSTPPVSVEV